MIGVNKMKKIISALLCAVLMLSCFTVAFAGESYDSFGAYEHVFIIGIDGLGASFSKVNSPNFDRIFADNAYRHNAHTEYITTSAQNWGSILTGVPYDVHGMTNDSTDISQPKRTSESDNNTIFYYTRKAIPDAKLISLSHWLNINHGIIESDIGVSMVHRLSDPMIADAVCETIQINHIPKLMFVQLDDVDHAAHTYGGFSDEYYAAAEKADGYLGMIYDTIESKGLMKDSLFIVVADHGETAGGHGGQTVEESSALLAVAGHSVNKTELGEDACNRDVAAIALYALGIEQPRHFEAKVPTGLFGESREKTVEKPLEASVDTLWHNFLYAFVRFANIIVGLFDFIQL